jgi:hypothetical protein
MLSTEYDDIFTYNEKESELYYNVGRNQEIFI